MIREMDPMMNPFEGFLLGAFDSMNFFFFFLFPNNRLPKRPVAMDPPTHASGFDFTDFLTFEGMSSLRLSPACD